MDINCPICYDTYNDKDKIPRILHCGHTFCQICLMDLRTSNILTCPTCRKFFSPEVKSLIKNFTILGKFFKCALLLLQITFITKRRLTSSEGSALRSMQTGTQAKVPTMASSGSKWKKSRLLTSFVWSIHKRKLSIFARTARFMCVLSAWSESIRGTESLIIFLSHRIK